MYRGALFQHACVSTVILLLLSAQLIDTINIIVDQYLMGKVYNIVMQVESLSNS